MTTTLSSSREKICVSVESFAEVVAVSVKLDNECMAIAAYGESRTPSVVLTRETFDKDPSSNQKIEFVSIPFKQFEGYKVWCCEIEGDELKACLVRSS